LYEHDGSNKAQLTRTIQIGRKHLAQMQAQRAELDLAITDLQTQLNEGERLLSAFSKSIPE
jgi:hypothetical protein